MLPYFGHIKKSKLCFWPDCVAFNKCAKDRNEIISKYDVYQFGCSKKLLQTCLQTRLIYFKNHKNVEPTEDGVNEI